jgi:hypothetical protein
VLRSRKAKLNLEVESVYFPLNLFFFIEHFCNAYPSLDSYKMRALVILNVLRIISAQQSTCQDPGELPNGGRVPEPPSTAGYAVGDELFFYCKVGFSLQNKGCITCSNDSVWLPKTAAQPFCQQNTSSHNPPKPDPKICKCNIGTGSFTCPTAPTPAPLATYDCKEETGGAFNCSIASGQSGLFPSLDSCSASCSVPTPVPFHPIQVPTPIPFNPTPAVILYQCINNKCVAGHTGANLTACEAICG